jgi:hypothetical protein
MRERERERQSIGNLTFKKIKQIENLTFKKIKQIENLTFKKIKQIEFLSIFLETSYSSRSGLLFSLLVAHHLISRSSEKTWIFC